MNFWTKNWHEDFGSRILGGRQNFHSHDICLDHINRMNAIHYQLNRKFLCKYEEAPTFTLDTREKREQWENFVKNSSLAAAIGYPDMVSLFAGTVLNQTGQAIETIAMTMSVYLIISLTISLLMNIYNRRIAIVER